MIMHISDVYKNVGKVQYIVITPNVLETGLEIKMVKQNITNFDVRCLQFEQHSLQYIHWEYWLPHWESFHLRQLRVPQAAIEIQWSLIVFSNFLQSNDILRIGLRKYCTFSVLWYIRFEKVYINATWWWYGTSNMTEK